MSEYFFGVLLFAFIAGAIKADADHPLLPFAFALLWPVAVCVIAGAFFSGLLGGYTHWRKSND